jgi:hypothetical protein
MPDASYWACCSSSSLAERRYAACDPDNRLIAAQLEKAWEMVNGSDRMSLRLFDQEKTLTS